MFDVLLEARNGVGQRVFPFGKLLARFAGVFILCILSAATLKVFHVLRDLGLGWCSLCRALAQVTQLRVQRISDMRRQGQEREPVPQIFESLAQNPPQSVDLLIRTSSTDPLALAAALRAAVRRVEKNAPIYGIAPLEEQLGSYLAQRRFQASLLAGFSLVAVLMAAVGIYGLIQYSAASRTQEIGLRMAIGAQRADIFRMMIGEGLTLSLSGLALGLVGALWLGHTVSSLLFGVTAADPLTFRAVSLLLTAVAIAACYFPARRAMKVDPIVALRVI